MAAEKIVLGSGKLYISEFSSTIPDNNILEVDDNLLGYIQGGAVLTYTPTFQDVKDDLGYVVETFLTNEGVIFKSGVLTWNGKTLEKLCGTARVEEDSEKKTRTVKIGGITNYNRKNYVIHFVHEDSINGDIRVTIIGSNQSGFELNFAKDKETVINAEFKAHPQDGEGTLIKYVEELVA